MTGIARAGRSTGYYGHAAQDLVDPIEEELQLLLARWGRKVRVRYRGLDGVQTRVLDSFRRPAHDTVELPDLAAPWRPVCARGNAPARSAAATIAVPSSAGDHRLHAPIDVRRRAPDAHRTTQSV